MIQYFQEGTLNAALSKNLLIEVSFAFMIFKLLFFVFLVIDDVVRILNYGFQSFSKFMGYTPEVDFDERRKIIVKLGLGVGIPFVSMSYGITKGTYNYKIKNVVLDFSNSLNFFDGFKLVQISDIHAGSFGSIEDVQRGVDLINEQNAEEVLFTGDLVNGDSREIISFIDTFKSIKPKVYSILGNHDYNKWDSKEAKKENVDLMDVYHKDMGFQLLKNEHLMLQKDGEEITLLGVENRGKVFKQKRDLDKALAGIDIPGFKRSPAKFRYVRWSGLCQEAKQYLYVNRGFGFLGFPGRIGMWPQITVIELKRA
jgi:predicted MPP superfamily phosphohydrolase